MVSFADVIGYWVVSFPLALCGIAASWPIWSIGSGVEGHMEFYTPRSLSVHDPKDAKLSNTQGQSPQTLNAVES